MKNLLFTLALLVSFSSYGQTPEMVKLLEEISNPRDKFDELSILTKAIDKNPNFSYAYYLRGHTKMNDFNDDKAALEDFKESVKLGIGFPDAFYKVGMVNARLGNNYDAISAYTRAIEAWEGYAGAYLARGEIKLKIGDLNSACEDWRKAIEVADLDDFASKHEASLAKDAIDKNCN
ncbi:hypothetical protein N9H05_02185 [Flavobacteriaceae bacterium]|jgi:tetratricopeptide (TPR) repeat protein|nr:hypothetical protein [Flavobacteriaceae bacterium]|tara:strand:+ start:108 stop:638 length:531 start_codon:yes stop_codon:yes gene_type:complete